MTPNKILLPNWSVAIALFFLVSCEPSPQVIPPNPDPDETPTATLEPGERCFTYEGDTLDASVQLTLAADGEVNGTSWGTIQNDAEGYYTSYTKSFAGELEDDRVLVEVTTEIEADTQVEDRVWLLLPDSLETEDRIYLQVPCDTLVDRQGVSVPEPLNLDENTGSVSVEKTLDSPQTQTYSISAPRARQLSVDLNSQSAKFDLVSPGGTILVESTATADLVLPETGEYLIVVSNEAGSETYSLNVELLSENSPINSFGFPDGNYFLGSVPALEEPASEYILMRSDRDRVVGYRYIDGTDNIGCFVGTLTENTIADPQVAYPPPPGSDANWTVSSGDPIAIGNFHLLSWSDAPEFATMGLRECSELFADEF